MGWTFVWFLKMFGRGTSWLKKLMSCLYSMLLDLSDLVIHGLMLSSHVPMYYTCAVHSAFSHGCREFGSVRLIVQTRWVHHLHLWMQDDAHSCSPYRWMQLVLSEEACCLCRCLMEVRCTEYVYRWASWRLYRIQCAAHTWQSELARVQSPLAGPCMELWRH